MPAIIAGSATALPERIVTNDQLALIMDTDDEWIRRRTGVEQRHIADRGVGASDLGAEALTSALADADLTPADVDVLITATMTPDLLAPGISPLVQDKAGLGQIAAYDLRQQCSGFLYGMELADTLIAAGRAETVGVVGAERHSGYMPFGSGWEVLTESANPEAMSVEDRAMATDSRAWSVLFGDGAGAMVMARSHDETAGIVAASLHTDGSLFDLIHVPGVGFANQPYVDHAALEARLHWPSMNGKELFRQASRLMPESVRSAAERAGVGIDDIELVIAHQANDRILDAVRGQLGFDDERVPSNIASYGNTTAATVPILYDDLRRAGRIGSDALVAFTTFGAGAHWGALLYRTP